MTPHGPAAAKRRSGRPTDAEILAAKRIVSRTERREVEEAERLCQDARRMLDAASADAEKSRSEAERVLAESRAKAGRILADAEAVLAESRAEAERIRAEAAAAKAPDENEALGGDNERRIREAALSAVDPSGVEVGVLQRLLSDDLSADVRLAALGALARTSDLDQLSALGLALADPEPMVRTSALETLPVAGASRAAAQLLGAADDHHEAVRAAAYPRLAGAPSWVLWMALGRCSHRSELVGAVREHDDADRLATLVVERVSSPDVDDRLLALELIGHLRTPELLAEAVHALADTEAAVRRAAVAQLQGCDQAIPALSVALGDDPDPTVRSQVAQSLMGAGTDEAIVAFLGALDDPDPDVRRLAVDALGHHPSVGLAHRLAAELTSANLGSVGELLVAMGAPGKEALAAVVADGPPERSSAAAELLRTTDGIVR